MFAIYQSVLFRKYHINILISIITRNMHLRSKLIHKATMYYVLCFELNININYLLLIYNLATIKL